jgi:hypothetical protein
LKLQTDFKYQKEFGNKNNKQNFEKEREEKSSLSGRSPIPSPLSFPWLGPTRPSQQPNMAQPKTHRSPTSP